jgi:periplasmic protein TonB
MEVTDVLRDRMHEPAGLQQMAVVSILLHGSMAAVLVLAPGGWLAQRVETPREVMTISLSAGTPGPTSGGMTAIGGRPVQVVTPPEEVKKPEPVRAPAAKAPEMTIPQKNARTRTGATNITQAPDEARGRTPTRGAETSRGSSIAETGVRGQGFGLTTGGGGGTGSALEVDNFCCPEYIQLMIQQVYGNWEQRVEVPGVATVRFTIQRDGRITDITLFKSSGYVAHDMNAQRALFRTRQLSPLPAQFPDSTLGVRLTFEYKR